ncbi:multidrug efflux protein [Halolamina pelagica]|uniref:Multidrug efflux protein n=1 Tax=Halolamina pelagica TaxID=699431 RepID=A0A0P7H8C6_9EURY|nr:multidrug efflux protein [Halolamina pelagica]
MFDLDSGEITEGRLSRALLVLAAPLVAQNLVQVANSAADVFWLGRLGDGAVGAVGLNQPIMALLFVPLTAAMVGTQVLVSQRIGGENQSGARKAVFHGVALAFVAGLALALLVAPTAGPIVRLLGAGPDVAPQAAAYLSTYMLLFPLTSVSDTVEMGFVGAGDSKTAMYLNFLAIGGNLVLDPLLIFGVWIFPEYGVAGAALATVLGYTMSMLLGLYWLAGDHGSISLSLADAGIDLDELREMVDIGLPAGASGWPPSRSGWSSSRSSRSSAAPQGWPPTPSAPGSRPSRSSPHRGSSRPARASSARTSAPIAPTAPGERHGSASASPPARWR